MSRSLHFSLSFHKFHFSMMLLFEPLRSLRSAPTAELRPLCSRSTPGVPFASHTLRRRFTCKLIFNPNTANSLYGTALTLLSQQQVSLELRALRSQLSLRLVSFLLVSVFHYLFDYYANSLTIQMTIIRSDSHLLSMFMACEIFYYH